MDRLGCPYSPKCVEGKFCALRLHSVLRSSYLESCISPPDDHVWQITSAELVEILGFRAAALGKKGGEGYE